MHATHVGGKNIETNTIRTRTHSLDSYVSASVLTIQTSTRKSKAFRCMLDSYFTSQKLPTWVDATISKEKRAEGPSSPDCNMEYPKAHIRVDVLGSEEQEVVSSRQIYFSSHFFFFPLLFFYKAFNCFQVRDLRSLTTFRCSSACARGLESS